MLGQNLVKKVLTSVQKLAACSSAPGWHPGVWVSGAPTLPHTAPSGFPGVKGFNLNACFASGSLQFWCSQAEGLSDSPGHD